MEAPREELARQAWSALADLFWSAEQHDRFHDACEATGLPHPGALKALLGLDPDQPRSMRMLADEMRCDASYITALVDALEDLRYVERRVSDADRRVKLVLLTPEGQRAKEAARHVLTAPPKALERLSDAELRRLAGLVAKLSG